MQPYPNGGGYAARYRGATAAPADATGGAEVPVAAFSDTLSPELSAWVAEQPLFFVATAPLQGRLNLSPKGMDTFRVLAPDRVAWTDLTGSGNETAAHLQDDPRITVMFCSFGPEPRILRLYGTARVVGWEDADETALLAAMPRPPGARQVMVMAVDSVQTSCGYAVPRMTLVEERTTLVRWAEKKGEDGLERYRHDKNRRSIDGRDVDVP